MNRFRHLLIAVAALVGGIWCFYAGYGRGLSLAGRTETGLGYVKTGLDGKTRVPTHRWYYAAGLALVSGGTWWLLHGHRPAPKRKSKRRR